MKKKIKIEKQYGLVNKEVMKNKNISSNAKGLYVYLCARSGNKNICNPSIATICRDLKINEATFHKLKRELINNKIIAVKKVGQGIEKRNHYTLLQKQNNNGYGIIYLDIAKDPNISLKSKAIYGLLSCIAGTMFIAYPKAITIYKILNMSRNTYFKALGMLKKNNYLVTKQLHVQGRFDHCNYYINGAKPNNKKTRYIFKFINKNKKKYSTNNNLSEGNNSSIIEYNNYENFIKSNIEYNTLIGQYRNNNKAIYLLDNMVNILISTIYYETKELMVNGRIVLSPIVKMIYNKLRYNNIKYVLDNILNTSSKIKNIREYLRVSLFNSYYQIEQFNYNNMRLY